MQTLHELYVQNPFWVWLAIGAVFVGLDISIGSGKLIWGGVAAAALAFINLAGVRLGSMAELALFSVVAVGGVVVAIMPWRPRPSAATSDDNEARAATTRRELEVEHSAFPMADERRTARLIGRIGRTTSDFANGVGRVWIDGAEWGAELDGEETLPSNTPVRIMGVTGGVRLHVKNLMIS
jgi:membrane protein implicated in regulation of membrane protease activity